MGDGYVAESAIKSVIVPELRAVVGRLVLKIDRHTSIDGKRHGAHGERLGPRALFHRFTVNSVSRSVPAVSLRDLSSFAGPRAPERAPIHSSWTQQWHRTFDH